MKIKILTSLRLFSVLRLGLRSTSLKSNLSSLIILGIVEGSLVFRNSKFKNKYIEFYLSRRAPYRDTRALSTARVRVCCQTTMIYTTIY